MDRFKPYVSGILGVIASTFGWMAANITFETFFSRASMVVGFVTGLVLMLKFFLDLHRAWKKDRKLPPYCEDCPKANNNDSRQ